MPLLTAEELSGMSPLFKGKWGQALARKLVKWLSVDKVNDLYDRNESFSGPDFARAVLEDIGLRWTASGPGLTSLPQGPFITVSNHPYGSIDGLVLVDLFGHLVPGYKVMVNKFLSRIKTLGNNFISVVPSGDTRSAPQAESISGIKESIRHIREGGALGFFPAGAVSNLYPFKGKVEDRPWQESVIKLIHKMHVPVVPVHFLDRNSDFYYLLGLIDWRIRVTRLPAEVFNKKDKPCRIVVGEPLDTETQDRCADIGELSALLRNSVYSLL